MADIHRHHLGPDGCAFPDCPRPDEARALAQSLNHVHVFVWVIRVPGPPVLIQRCACGQLGPLSPYRLRRA